MNGERTAEEWQQSKQINTAINNNDCAHLSTSLLGKPISNQKVFAGELSHYKVKLPFCYYCQEQSSKIELESCLLESEKTQSLAAVGTLYIPLGITAVVTGKERKVD